MAFRPVIAAFDGGLLTSNAGISLLAAPIGRVDILVRGNSHYGRQEAVSWCERNRVGYVCGLG